MSNHTLNFPWLVATPNLCSLAHIHMFPHTQTFFIHTSSLPKKRETRQMGDGIRKKKVSIFLGVNKGESQTSKYKGIHISRSEVVFYFIYSMHAPCLLRENFHGFYPQGLPFFYFPQKNSTVSPQRELSRTFSLNGLSLSSPVDTVSPQRVLSQILFSVVFIFILLLNPQQFCPPMTPFYFIIVMR